MFDDIRFSLRVLLRRRGLSSVAVLTLALGIGASAAVFSVLNGVVLKPLAYPNSDNLVNIYRLDPPVIRGPLAKQDLMDVHQTLKGLATVTGFEQLSYTVGTAEGANRLLGARVAENFFAVFGLDPIRGRWIDRGDQSGTTDGVVISERLWEQQFGRRDAAIGSELVLNGERWTVIGIAPPTMDYPTGADVWVPMRLSTLDVERGYSFIQLTGRLDSDASSGGVQARLNTLAAHLAQEFPEHHRDLTLQVVHLQDALVSGVRESLWMLMIAVAMVVLIVCANVANLMLSRILAREQEFATRAALGADPIRLARQAMIEALLLGVFGAVGGLGIAAIAIKSLIALQPPELPRLDAISLDLRVLAFATGAAVITGILCGLLPARRALRTDFTSVLHGSSADVGRGRLWMRRSLIVVGEVALSMALLVAAGLLFTTMQRISSVDPGFDRSNLLTGMIALPAPQPSGNDPDAYFEQVQRNAPFLARLQTRLASMPGVTAVGFIDSMPLSDSNNFSGTITVPGVAFESGNEPTVEYRWISHGYFRAIGVPFVAGEGFEGGGIVDWPPGGSIVINEALAELLWPGAEADALGKQINIDALGGMFTVGGVVGNARQWTLDREPSPELYLPYSSTPAPSTTTVVMRTSVPPLNLADSLRREVSELNRQVPVFKVRTMEQAAAVGNARRAFALTLLIVFAIAAAFVAAIGLYGVMSYSVTQRTREVGVRMALGAKRGEVLRGFLRDGMKTALVGIGIGCVVALIFARLLQGLVWGVDLVAPLIYVATGGLLILVALVATLQPALRASRISPMRALRYE